MRLYERRRCASSEIYSGRNANVEAQIERGMNFQRNFFAFEFLHRFFQETNVGVIADGFNMAVLFAAQQIACAAQFQIKRGDFEACSEVAKFFERRQTFACHFAQLRIDGTRQIRIGAAV